MHGMDVHDEIAYWRERATRAEEQLATVTAERDTYRSALEKISAIRDSIVGMQGFNFSEHAYPLVAHLDAAGFKGAGYEISRKNLGTLIEQRDAAIAEVARMRPVFEAAVNWRERGPGQSHCDEENCPCTSANCRLKNAIDTATGEQGK